jgi:hypothetical protein
MMEHGGHHRLDQPETSRDERYNGRQHPGRRGQHHDVAANTPAAVNDAHRQAMSARSDTPAKAASTTRLAGEPTTDIASRCHAAPAARRSVIGGRGRQNRSRPIITAARSALAGRRANRAVTTNGPIPTVATASNGTTSTAWRSPIVTATITLTAASSTNIRAENH